jgi:hypothetical protein
MDAQAEAQGPSWARTDWPPQPADDWTNALTGEWPAAQAEVKEAGKKIKEKAAEKGVEVTDEQVQRAVLDSIRALMLIRAYRIRGHLVADLDPLGMRDQTPHPELDPKSYGFTEADMDRPIFLDNVLGLQHGVDPRDRRHREAHLLRHLRAAIHAYLRPRTGRLAEGADRGFGKEMPSPAKAGRRS